MLHLALAVLLAIDLTKSTAQFSVAHVFVEHVTGTVPIASGTIEVPPGSLVPTSVNAVLDPTRIATGEPDRDRSLESPDFFDAKRFPTWTFVSTSIVPTAAGFTMDGLLTVHGVTRSEHLLVTVSGDPHHPVYHASCEIDRHAFGMAITRLDPVIGGTVDVTLEIRTK